MIFRKDFSMQIFEINKKIQMFWFFLALPSFPREKAFKKNKSRGRNDDLFINNGNAETNMPLQKYHFRLGQGERIVILKNKT